ncbi:hypothetical protein PLCT1_00815 [Planctomycetaceae bacterium]|nr:hypothetical protein PLCT1_00815 [Planctomycetaceae bacterium]
MFEEERATTPLAASQLVSYVMGELEPDQQQKLEAQIKESPALAAELEEIRGHLSIHQQVRKVAPRRGSFDRLIRHMKHEGALAGAVPGVHCMLRRAFIFAAVAGLIFIALMAIFSDEQSAPLLPTDKVIGQIIYYEPAPDSISSHGRELDQGEALAGATKNFNSYDVSIWIPTGISRSYSIIECSQGTVMSFESSREVTLRKGFMRQLNIAPGALGEGAFTVKTPHGRVEISGARLSIKVSEADTQVTVGEGSARVIGGDVPQIVPAGHFSVISRDAEAQPPQPVLQISLLLYNDPKVSAPIIEVTLRNVGYVPARIKRVNSGDPVFIHQISRDRDYADPGSLPETYDPVPVSLIGNYLEHRGETWLKPKEDYKFRIDISENLMGRPAAQYWITVVYKGGLYGPQGAAMVDVTSKPLQIDMRNK